MSPTTYTKIVLNERPKTDIDDKTFRSEHASLSGLKPGDGETLIKVTWLSLDPAMRGYLNDVRSYMPPVKIGEVMRAMGLGYVVSAGSASKLSKGDLVTGAFGWAEYAVMKDKDVSKIILPKGAEPLDFLNTLGTSGLTAYFGLHKVGQIKKGETLLVSGAAGSVGVIVCQLGVQLGANVYAIAGSKDKCDWLEREIGVKRAFNYKDKDFRKSFKEIGYMDVFFDNVGGSILDMALTRLNQKARIVLCGAISAYNAPKPEGIQNYLTLIAQRGRVEGFIVFDYASEYPAAIEVLAKGLADGSIKRKFHVVEGLESAPKALPMLFSGGNTGKLVVKVSEEPFGQPKVKL